MTPTVFGVLIILIGGWLLVRGSTLAMLMFVMAATLMGGSAAFVLTALGGSSVPPATAAAMLLALRCLAPGGQRPALRPAASANALLILFGLYGALSAFVLPHIFAGAIDVMPLRPIKSKDPFVTYPLVFSTQNITVAVYLLTTMIGSICAYVAVQQTGAERAIARTAAAVAIVHAVLGFVSVAVARTPLAAILEFFRNGSYAQLDQAVGGVVRMNGIHPEPSAYAAFGFVWLIFTAELWLRDVEKRWTLPAAALLFIALVASTSSTAYIGIGAYAIILALRKLFFPSTISTSKLLGAAGLGLVVAVCGLLIVLLRPELYALASDVLARMTVEKSETLSGMQRLMWAKQGITAFWASGGLGVGAGSFRSSSLLTAIIGSVGVIGAVAFAGHLLRVLHPLHQSTYVRTGDPRTDVGVAASWTALVMLVPVSFSAPSPDPGLVWGLMSGLALGLRRVTEVRSSSRAAAGSVRRPRPRHQAVT